MLQSALGNLPELFVSIFALRAGLIGVVQGSIVGSILANVLGVLGLSFVVGGLRHGTQKFGSEQGRMASLLLVLAVSALMLPSLTAALHTPAAGHEVAFSRIVAVVLLAVFMLSLPASLQRQTGTAGAEAAREKGDPVSREGAVQRHEGTWPLGMAIGVLAAAGVGAAFVSEWFVHALEPAIETLGISQAFAGLVVVAIAGNAIENVVGVQLAARGQADYAVSVILQSPL